MKLIIHSCFLVVLLMLSACGKVSQDMSRSNSVDISSASLSKSSDASGDYPIIFIHGHSGNYDGTRMWEPVVINHLNGVEGYQYFDSGEFRQIYSDTAHELETNSLSKKSLFMFNYYIGANNGSQFHDKAGHIGGLPEQYRFEGYDVHNGEARVSYAERLSVVVDDVLRATGASKVQLVGYSLGGIVSRAYVKWLGGHEKVHKLLTVGSPNGGLDAAFYLNDWAYAIVNKHDWQWQGELLELKKQAAFHGLTYTDYLNDAWEEFCNENNVLYATVIGGKDPYGDGLVNKHDGALKGAVFNSITHVTYHAPDESRDNDEHVGKSTHVAEVIRHWMMRNEIREGLDFSKKFGEKYFQVHPTSEKNKFSVSYHALSKPVSGTLHIYHHAADNNHDYIKHDVVGFPIEQGDGFFTFTVPDIDKRIKLEFRAYDMFGYTWDMNGNDSVFFDQYYIESEDYAFEDDTTVNFASEKKPYYHSNDYINAGNGFAVHSTDSILFEAQKGINLEPGFTAEKGSNFDAKL